ncbi:hypothetical protein BD769DRAFT_1388506 [Suillus cothurnatus]|nr:hypothetical protein BD769DRAFT_1388506 [Suillus cothurnatus]
MSTSHFSDWKNLGKILITEKEKTEFDLFQLARRGITRRQRTTRHFPRSRHRMNSIPPHPFSSTWGLDINVANKPPDTTSIGPDNGGCHQRASLFKASTFKGGATDHADILANHANFIFEFLITWLQPLGKLIGTRFGLYPAGLIDVGDFGIVYPPQGFHLLQVNMVLLLALTPSIAAPSNLSKLTADNSAKDFARFPRRPHLIVINMHFYGSTTSIQADYCPQTHYSGHQESHY